MWPIIFRVMRQYAPVITLPFAALVGIIGYNIENLLSDKYTPYNEAIKDKRGDRLLNEEVLANATTQGTQGTQGKESKYKTNVLNTNLSPSLQN